MIDLQNITITYEGKEIISNFTLHIEAGEKVCISGKSGCGKSSLLMALLGFIQPSSGTICYNGAELTATNVQSVREKVGFLSQDISFPQQTVRELIDAPFHFKANRQKLPTTARILETFASLARQRDTDARRTHLGARPCISRAGSPATENDEGQNHHRRVARRAVCPSFR